MRFVVMALLSFCFVSCQNQLTYTEALKGHFLSDAKWAPDGKSIAFISSINNTSYIWLMNTDGSNLRQLTTNDYERILSISWSPDSLHIVFESIENGKYDVIIVSIENSLVQNITQTLTIGETNPLWSPDGRFIVYSVTDDQQRDLVIFDYNTKTTNNLTININE